MVICPSESTKDRSISTTQYVKRFTKIKEYETKFTMHTSLFILSMFFYRPVSFTDTNSLRDYRKPEYFLAFCDLHNYNIIKLWLWLYMGKGTQNSKFLFFTFFNDWNFFRVVTLKLIKNNCFKHWSQKRP